MDYRPDETNEQREERRRAFFSPENYAARQEANESKKDREERLAFESNWRAHQEGIFSEADNKYVRKLLKAGKKTLWRDLEGKLRPRAELPPGPTFYRWPDGSLHQRME